MDDIKFDDEKYDRDREMEMDSPDYKKTKTSIREELEKDKAMAEIEQARFEQQVIPFLKKKYHEYENDGYVPSINLLIEELEEKYK